MHVFLGCRGKAALAAAQKVLQRQDLACLELYSFEAAAKNGGLDVRLDKVLKCIYMYKALMSLAAVFI